MRISIAGDEYEGTANDGAIKTSFKFPSIEIDETSKIKILVDTDENAEDGAYATF
jgi:hypothetical protein